MKLFSLLRKPWLFSLSAAGIGLLTTVATVYFAGPTVFAEFTIDLAKLSLLSLVFELVPSPHAIFRAQSDKEFQVDLASFALASGLLVIGASAVLIAIGWISDPSPWIALYLLYLAGQRYLDVKLQAEGRLDEYFQLTFVANVGRLALLLTSFAILPRGPKSEILWAALALGSAASLAIWLVRRPTELSPFARRDHAHSLLRIIEARERYAPYYLNVALKRVRDAAMPLLCGAVVSDRVEVARYLLAYRGLDFVLGQLRVAEAVLNNFSHRLSLRPSRTRQFLLLAMIGQAAAFGASMFLAAQAGIDAIIVPTALVASLLVYPYVAELVRRSDAYATVRPTAVTISLASYVVVLVVVIAGLRRLDLLTAPFLVMAPLLAQSTAAVSYGLAKRAAD